MAKKYQYLAMNIYFLCIFLLTFAPDLVQPNLTITIL